MISMDQIASFGHDDDDECDSLPPAKRLRADGPSQERSTTSDHHHHDLAMPSDASSSSSLMMSNPYNWWQSRQPVDNINQLPSEVFQLIISRFLKSNNWRKLVPLRLVARHWRDNIDSYLASRHGFQYSGVVAKGQPPPNINYYEFNAMLGFYPNMRQLIIKNFTVSDHLVAILRQNCPHLDRLSLFGCRNLSWKGVTVLTVRFSELTFVDVSHCNLDENRFEILVSGLKRLKILNAINPGRDVTGECLSKLGPEIEDVWIGLNHLTDPNPALRALAAGNGKRLLHFGVVVTCFQKTDWTIITDNMRQLKSLKMTFGSQGRGSLANLSQLKQLEFLVLAEDSRDETGSILTDDNLAPVIRNCKLLRSLAVAGTKANTCRFTDYSIGLIPKFCPKMEQIRMLNANRVSDWAIEEVGKLANLRVLHLSSMSNVSDNGVFRCVQKAAKTIRNFRVSDCEAITEKVIDAWIPVAKARPTEKIKIYLEAVEVTRSTEGLPGNLKLDVKTKAEAQLRYQNRPINAPAYQISS